MFFDHSYQVILVSLRKTAVVPEVDFPEEEQCTTDFEVELSKQVASSKSDRDFEAILGRTYRLLYRRIFRVDCKGIALVPESDALILRLVWEMLQKHALYRVDLVP